MDLLNPAAPRLTAGLIRDAITERAAPFLGRLDDLRERADIDGRDEFAETLARAALTVRDLTRELQVMAGRIEREG
jgi:hypothetical protein